MSRYAEYRTWSIDAAPLLYSDMFRACAIVERAPQEGEECGLRFVFSDLGDCATRDAAHNRGIWWAKRWLDENFR